MQPDELDNLFRAGLESHRTPPPRALWERLEDELRPPKPKRRAAWWPLALAAVVALLLVAGGAGMWRDARPPAGGNGRRPELASRGRRPSAGAARRAALPAAAAKKPLLAAIVPQPAKSVRAAGTKPASGRAPAKAGIPNGATAGPTVALGPVSGAGPAAQTGHRSRPAGSKAAFLAAQLSTEKRTGGRATRPGRPASSPPNAGLVARQPAPAPRPPASIPGPQPVVPAAAPVAVAVVADVIEVDVRRGGGPGGTPAPVSRPGLAAAPPAADLAAEARPRRRLRGGGLGSSLDGVLGGAGRVVRTARQGLNALHELPDNLTVQARVGERTVSKTLGL